MNLKELEALRCALDHFRCHIRQETKGVQLTRTMGLLNGTENIVQGAINRARLGYKQCEEPHNG